MQSEIGVSTCLMYTTLLVLPKYSKTNILGMDNQVSHKQVIQCYDLKHHCWLAGTR